MVDTIKLYVPIQADADISPIETHIKSKNNYNNFMNILNESNPHVYVVRNRKVLNLYMVGTIGGALAGTNERLPGSAKEVAQALEIMRKDAVAATGLKLPNIGEWRLSRVDLTAEWTIQGNPDSIIRTIHQCLNRTRSDEIKLYSDSDGASLSCGNIKSHFWRLYDKSRKSRQALNKLEGHCGIPSTRQLRFEVGLSGYALKKQFSEGLTVQHLISFLEDDWQGFMQDQWDLIIGKHLTVSQEDVLGKLQHLSGAKQLQVYETFCTINAVGVEAYKAATSASADTIRRHIRSLEEAGLPRCTDMSAVPSYMRQIPKPNQSNSLNFKDP